MTLTIMMWLFYILCQGARGLNKKPLLLGNQHRPIVSWAKIRNRRDIIYLLYWIYKVKNSGFNQGKTGFNKEYSLHIAIHLTKQLIEYLFSGMCYCTTTNRAYRESRKENYWVWCYSDYCWIGCASNKPADYNLVEENLNGRIWRETY